LLRGVVAAAISSEVIMTDDVSLQVRKGDWWVAARPPPPPQTHVHTRYCLVSMTPPSDTLLPHTLLSQPPTPSPQVFTEHLKRLAVQS
jgi:hypothetical protein